MWRFIVPREGLMLWVNDENVHLVHNGTSWDVLSVGGGSSGSITNQGRLTLTSATPVTSSDVTAATTIYFTPYTGNRIALYNGSTWDVLSFSEVSLAVPATTNTLYDVWAYNNSGSVALETTAWTNDTTRAAALALQNGVYCRSGTLTRRYLGSVRTTGTSGQTEDSRAKRYVWNYAHRVDRLLSATESAANWTYSSATWRAANNSSSNRVDFVRGVNEDSVNVTASLPVMNSTSTLRVVSIGIGEDTTTTVHGRYAQDSANNSGSRTLTAFYDGMPSAGRHYLSLNEFGGGTDTQTWYSNGYFGIFGKVRG